MVFGKLKEKERKSVKYFILRYSTIKFKDRFRTSWEDCFPNKWFNKPTDCKMHEGYFCTIKHHVCVTLITNGKAGA